MFLHASVILLTGGMVSGEPPRDQAENPPPPGPGRYPPGTRQTPPWDQADTPPMTKENPPRQGEPPPRGPGRHPPPPGRENPPPTPGTRQTRSMSGRYASYWNAYLLHLHVHCVKSWNVMSVLKLP